MVPSWTETLIEAGINVVGRTRFCIHPAEKVAQIPIVGGTKEASWDLIGDLKPDIILLDQEENPLEMAEDCPYQYLATHVNSLETLQKELARLGEFFQNPGLLEMSADCFDILAAPRSDWSSRNIPGLREIIKEAENANTPVTYVIWMNPWMSVSRDTYIGSVLEKLGAQILLLEEGEKYPVIEIEGIKESFFLFSSEPFPFHKKVTELRALGVPGAVVDGECFSWFGIRSLRFLKKQLGLA